MNALSILNSLVRKIRIFLTQARLSMIFFLIPEFRAIFVAIFFLKLAITDLRQQKNLGGIPCNEVKCAASDRNRNNSRIN